MTKIFPSIKKRKLLVELLCLACDYYVLSRARLYFWGAGSHIRGTWTSIALQLLMAIFSVPNKVQFSVRYRGYVARAFQMERPAGAVMMQMDRWSRCAESLP